MIDPETANIISTTYGDLHYVKYGKGENILLVFHGFDQDHRIATPFSQLLSTYTVYSFDLPFHGKSIWKEKNNILTKSTLRKVFAQWSSVHQVEEFAVLGYSMGGKFAITLAEVLPNKVSHLFLIAPDGLYASPWYRIATSWPLVGLFKRLIDHPALFFSFTKAIRKAGTIPDKIIRFAESKMATRELRVRVYYSWYYSKRLFIDKSTLRHHISTNQLTALLILGEKDTIINPEKVLPTIQDVGFKVKVPNAGHASVLEIAPAIIKDFL